MHSTQAPALRLHGFGILAVLCLVQALLHTVAAAAVVAPPSGSPSAPPHARAPRIAVLHAKGCVDDGDLQILRSLGSVSVFDGTFDERGTIERIRGQTIVIANPYGVALTQPVFAAADSLKLLVLTITGFDRVDLDAANERGIRVLNTPDYSTEAVAEHTFALMLGVIRHIPQADAAVRHGQFGTPALEGKLLGVELAGRTLGVVGLGRIGTRVAEIARGFGMRTIGWDRSDKGIAGVEQMPLDQLLAQSDIVTLHVALNKETAGLLGASRLRLMKPRAVLINTARAELIDENALYAALQAGRLAGAGLDLLGAQSLSNPLLKLDNVVLSPHSAYHTIESRVRCGDSVVAAARAYLAGQLGR
ncbi:MAG TPA: NAD(P)-dependent oxidoreductase [Steroidobacteraceae bacterium]|nr:NAD(P)-dependent oxidoreductase [Steroidobacteraceae bacterium]